MSLPLSALTLATPLALWGLGLAVPIVFFHLYHRRRTRLLVPFLPLLLESTGPARREARFRRLREAASLLLRLLALACLVLALGGLRPVEGGRTPTDLLLVVDADVTTATREAEGALRLGRGLALAEAWIKAQPGPGPGGADLEAPVSVLLAGHIPRLLVAPTMNRTEALKHLAITPTPASSTSDLGVAVRLAVEAAAERPAARVIVLSARALPLPRVPPHVSLEMFGVGQARNDQGITDFSLDRLPEKGGYRVRVDVRNEDAAARSRTLRVQVGDAVAAREDVLIPAGAVREVSLRVPAPPKALWLEVRLEGEDVFPANDSVQARLTPLPRPSLLVVHAGAVRPYTAAMVEALVHAGLVDEQQSGFVNTRDLAAAGPRDVVLVDGVALEVAGLKPGAYVFLAPLEGALPFELGPPLEAPLLWRTAPNHPLVSQLDFQHAFVARGRSVEGEGLIPLAFAEGRTVIAEGQRAGVRYVVLGLDPEESALPYQAALPLLVRKAILRLATAPSAPLRGFYRRGEALRPPMALPGGPHVTIGWEGPAGDPVLARTGRGEAEVRIDPEGATWRVAPGAVGRATLRTGDGGGAWTGYTALLDFDAERRIAPVRAEGTPPPAAVLLSPVDVRWRRWLLAVAVLLLLLDLLLLVRTRRVRRAATTA